MARIRPIIPISEQNPPSIAANTGITLYLPNGIRYQGVYYTVNGQYITTPTLTTSTVVLTTTPQFVRDTTIYDTIKGDQTSLFVQPISFVPTVTENDIAIGYIQRYFVMKRNEPGRFIEVSETQYAKYSTNNQKAIDANLWKRFELRWLVSGDLETVKALNYKTVITYEREDNLPGLSKFLFKLDEFYLGKR